MSNIALLSFSQATDIVGRIWADCEKPVLNEVNYIEDDSKIKINYIDNGVSCKSRKEIEKTRAT